MACQDCETGATKREAGLAQWSFNIPFWIDDFGDNTGPYDVIPVYHYEQGEDEGVTGFAVSLAIGEAETRGHSIGSWKVDVHSGDTGHLRVHLTLV